MTDFKKTAHTLQQSAFKTAKTLLAKYQNPHDLKLEENSSLEDSYTILITLLYTEKLNPEDQLAIVSIIDEMKRIDGNL